MLRPPFRTVKGQQQPTRGLTPKQQNNSLKRITTYDPYDLRTQYLQRHSICNRTDQNAFAKLPHFSFVRPPFSFVTTPLSARGLKKTADPKETVISSISSQKQPHKSIFSDRKVPQNAVSPAPRDSHRAQKLELYTLIYPAFFRLLRSPE